MSPREQHEAEFTNHIAICHIEVMFECTDVDIFEKLCETYVSLTMFPSFWSLLASSDIDGFTH